MSAMVACHYDPYLRSIYLKSVEKGMVRKSALCKIMKKMLRMLYGMLSNNQCYNPQIDAQYRERYQQQSVSIETTQKNEQNEGVTYLMKSAPISKKNAHHRKEQTSAVIRTRSSNRTLAAPSNFLPKT